MNCKLYPVIAFVFLALAGLHCESEQSSSIGGDADSDSTNDSSTDADSDSDADGDTEVPPGCGDGVLTSDEACDDANKEDGDGCSGDCGTVAEGWSCNPPGMACRQVARCGDGQVAFPELCDDQNVAPGDGCSALCKVEIGYKCDHLTDASSVCTPTVCGDAAKEGAEGCDDANSLPFDGCDETCQVEPTCAAGTACSSACGDGVVLEEACDDGNITDGDGCSSTCTVEDGYECIQEEIGNNLVVPVVYRDFLESHSDFEVNINVKKTGMVEATLGADGRPVLVPGVASSAGVSSAASFNQWYNDVPGTNMTVVDSLTLARDSLTGNYMYTNCAFFPLDTQGYSGADTLVLETKKDAAYAGGCPKSDGTSYNWEAAGAHAFYFTSEVRFWFQYTGTHQLQFIGDDDVWVFVNGHLTADLGGIHAPETGVVNITATNGATLGMEIGKVYEIVVFQAERHVTGSSYRLTLSGFNTARSDCKSICGDGIVGIGEECDDAVNDGGYGECGAGCVLGEYCGDGVQQPEEHCDDGNSLDYDECPSSCRIVDIG